MTETKLPKFIEVENVRVLRASRSVNTPVNDNRMPPEELEAGMRRLSENFVQNTEYAMSMMEEKDMNWKKLAEMTGLSTSTIYTIKNGGANTGTATAVQFARVFGIDPAIMFEPYDRFVVLYSGEKAAKRKRM